MVRSITVNYAIPQHAFGSGSQAVPPGLHTAFQIAMRSTSLSVISATLPDIGRQYANWRALISERSRPLYGRPYEIIERKLEQWSSNWILERRPN
jgi:hypothetical protein